MSQTIENKVVEMKFDNKNFENNIADSIKSLEKLEKSLDMSSSIKSFDKLDTAVSNVSFDKMANAVDNIASKFNLLEVIAISAVNRITSRVTDMALNMASSLSIDQITSGWGKYADKTTAVQTIMSAINDADIPPEFQSKMDYVEAQIEKLNWFTDETSYNFVDMVGNIGKFTSAGVALENSVASMQGIATWAAISGQNAQAASRAMYNLSQALGTGYIRVTDWMSIENANMATKEFKEMAIEAAVASGALRDLGNSQYVVADTEAKVNITAQNFRDTLKDKWFDTNTLNTVLASYSSFAEVLYEISDALDDAGHYTTTSDIIRDLDAISESAESAGKTYAEVISENSKYAKYASLNLDELTKNVTRLGIRAFKAAQEAKTFQEAIDSVKDASSTGWMNFFEKIFGNYEEAKELWTDFANYLYDVFVTPLEYLNNIATAWNELHGRQILFGGAVVDTIHLFEGEEEEIETTIDVITEYEGAFHHLSESISSWVAPIRDAFRLIFFGTNEDSEDGIQTLENLIPSIGEKIFEATKKFSDFAESIALSEENSALLFNAFRGIFSGLKSLAQGFGKIFSAIKPIKDVLSDLLHIVLFVANGFTDAFAKLASDLSNAKIFDLIANVVKSAIEKISNVTGILSGIASNVGSAFEFVYESLSTFAQVIWSKLEPAVTKIKEAFNDLWNTLFVAEDDAGKTWFGRLIDDITKGASGIWNAALTVLTDIVAAIAAVFTGFVGLFKKNNKENEETVKESESIWSRMLTFFENLGKKLGKVFTSIYGFLKDFVQNTGAVLTGFVEFLKSNVWPGLKNVFSLLGKIASDLWSVISKFNLIDALDRATVLMGKLWDFIKVLVPALLGLGTTGSIAASFSNIFAPLTTLQDTFGQMQDIVSNIWDNVMITGKATAKATEAVMKIKAVGSLFESFGKSMLMIAGALLITKYALNGVGDPWTEIGLPLIEILGVLSIVAAVVGGLLGEGGSGGGIMGSLSLKGGLNVKTMDSKIDAVGDFMGRLGIMLLMTAAAIKIVSTVKSEDILQIGIIIGVIAGVVLLFTTVMVKIASKAKDATVTMRGVGSLLQGMSIFLLSIVASLGIMAKLLSIDKIRENIVAGFWGVALIMIGLAVFTAVIIEASKNSKWQSLLVMTPMILVLEGLILELAVLATVLGFVPYEVLDTGLTALKWILTIIALFLAFIGVYIGNSKWSTILSMTALIGSLVGFIAFLSVSIVAIGKYIGKATDEDWTNLILGVLGVIGLFAAVLALVGLISLAAHYADAKALFGMSFMMTSLIAVILALGAVSMAIERMTDPGQTLGYLALFMAIIGVFMLVVGGIIGFLGAVSGDNFVSAIKSLAVLALSITGMILILSIITVAVGSISDPKVIEQGLYFLGGVLLYIGLFMVALGFAAKLSDKTGIDAMKKLITALAVVGGLVIAIVILAAITANVPNLKETLADIGGVVKTLAILMVALGAASKLSDGVKMSGLVAMAVIASLLMLAMTVFFSVFSVMTPEEMQSGITGLIVVAGAILALVMILGLVAIACQSVDTAPIVSMLIGLSVTLALLAFIMNMLGGMSTEEMATGTVGIVIAILALAGAIALLAAVCMALSPGIIILEGFAGSMLMISAAIAIAVGALILIGEHFETFKNGLKAVADAVTGVIDFIFGLVDSFFRWIGNAISNLWNDWIWPGLSSLLDSVWKWFSETMVSIGSWASDIGHWLLEGLAKPFENIKESKPYKFVANFVNGIKNLFTSKSEGFDINSPSKWMAKIGGYVMEGFANGVVDKVSTAIDSSENAKDAIKGVFENGFGDFNIQDMIPEGALTITPVLDLDEVKSGIGDMDSMLEGSSIKDLTGSYGLSLGSFGSVGSASGLTFDTANISNLSGITSADFNNMNATSMSNTAALEAKIVKVSDAVNYLRTDVMEISSKLGTMKIVMDSGELVGAIAGSMDSALGRRAIYAGRGMY